MNSIVYGGEARIVPEGKPPKEIIEIIARIEEEYRPKVESAGFLKRHWLLWRMKQEIKNSIKESPSPYALYYANHVRLGSVGKPSRESSKQDS